VAELALDHVERDAFPSHLDGVGVAQLVWRKAAPYPSGNREVAKLLSCGRSRPGPLARWAVDHAGRVVPQDEVERRLAKWLDE
jgi:hypothetical protein